MQRARELPIIVADRSPDLSRRSHSRVPAARDLARDPPKGRVNAKLWRLSGRWCAPAKGASGQEAAERASSGTLAAATVRMRGPRLVPTDQHWRWTIDTGSPHDPGPAMAERSAERERRMPLKSWPRCGRVAAPRRCRPAQPAPAPPRGRMSTPKSPRRFPSAGHRGRADVESRTRNWSRPSVAALARCALQQSVSSCRIPDGASGSPQTAPGNSEQLRRSPARLS